MSRACDWVDSSIGRSVTRDGGGADLVELLHFRVIEEDAVRHLRKRHLVRCACACGASVCAVRVPLRSCRLHCSSPNARCHFSAVQFLSQCYLPSPPVLGERTPGGRGENMVVMMRVLIALANADPMGGCSKHSPVSKLHSLACYTASIPTNA